ncbi:uncharacterized protein TNCV_3995851 [Trichonephila clavipes]|nr:uncharacterized protein TNCV_3995851 [Trichonephila clavipes]
MSGLRHRKVLPKWPARSFGLATPGLEELAARSITNARTPNLQHTTICVSKMDPCDSLKIKDPAFISLFLIKDDLKLPETLGPNSKFKYDEARRRFVEWAQNEIAVVPDFHKRIFFSDEAHFWLNGYVNKQNCHIWSEANPQVYVETPLHPEKLTVSCALWAGGIIGPYFFKNDECHNVTVNGDRYRAMITNFFIPELNTHDVQEL